MSKYLFLLGDDSVELPNDPGPDQHGDLKLQPDAGPVHLLGHKPAQLHMELPLSLLQGEHIPNLGLSEDEGLPIAVADGKS